MRRRGSILLITLWLIAVLSALAVAIGRHVSLELKIVGYRVAHAQARALAQGGVRTAVAILQRDFEQKETPSLIPYDWLKDEWADEIVRQTPGYDAASAPVVTAEIVDEDRYANLNTIDESSLGNVGVSPEAAKAIINDRDAHKDGEDRSEMPYKARNTWFTIWAPVSDVPDMTPEALRTLKAATSPYRGDNVKTINLNTATREALRGLGVTNDGIDEVKDYLNTPANIFKDQTAIRTILENRGLLDQNDLKILREQAIHSDVFTIESTGQMPNSSVKYTIEAVIKRDTEPGILAWREQ